MKRVAIVGGGIAGVAAAYELARQQRAGAPIAFTLFEAADRLGGIVETERRGGFIVECGPDSWVTEKPWARELAIELGLESELIFSEDEHRKTYLAEGNALLPMPDGMRMMVPTDLSSILASNLFSPEAKLAYQREPERAEELKAAALDASGRDESVRDFVIRHFGAEVANTIAAPLLAGVLGGDIGELSVRAVLPAYVALEREHGSLILGLQQHQRQQRAAPVFTSLRNGVASLIDRMESHIPAEDIRRHRVRAIERRSDGWCLQVQTGDTPTAPERFDAAILATPAKETARLLAGLDPAMAQLLPQRCSSAIVAALAFSPEQAQAMRIPRGFGFLAPQRGVVSSSGSAEALAQQALLACTFVDQKFADRAPAGALLLRAFFGGDAAPALLPENDARLAALARSALTPFLGPLPKPLFSVVRRWPDSLPLYAVGHLSRIEDLERLAGNPPHLRLLGNAYRGVGLPDLIRDGRRTARELVAALSASIA